MRHSVRDCGFHRLRHAVCTAVVIDNKTTVQFTTRWSTVRGAEASIGRKCTIEEGALISYGVTIGEGKTIRGEHRITRAKRRRENDEELVRGDPDFEVVGKGGDGFEFQDSDEDDEDEVVDNLISSGPSRFLTAEHYGHG